MRLVLFQPVATTAAVLALILLLVQGRAEAQTFDASVFFQSEVGDQWVYRWNGAQDVTLDVIGTELIDGTVT